MSNSNVGNTVLNADFKFDKKLDSVEQYIEETMLDQPDSNDDDDYRFSDFYDQGTMPDDDEIEDGFDFLDDEPEPQGPRP
ncbi:hypothetical protein ACTOV4_10095 [Brucella sp. C7-11G]